MTSRQRTLIKGLDKAIAKATSREWSDAFRSVGIEFGGPEFTKFKRQLHKAAKPVASATKKGTTANAIKPSVIRKIQLGLDALDEAKFVRVSPTSEYGRWLNIIGNVHPNVNSLLVKQLPLPEKEKPNSNPKKR